MTINNSIIKRLFDSKAPALEYETKEYFWADAKLHTQQYKMASSWLTDNVGPCGLNWNNWMNSGGTSYRLWCHEESDYLLFILEWSDVFNFKRLR